MNRKKITPVPINGWCVSKVHSIARHESMPKGLKTKDINETVCFDSYWTARVDHRYENEISSEEKEEDADCEPELDSDSENDGSSSDEDEEGGSPPNL